MKKKISRIINGLFFHDTWDIVVVKDNGTHSFPKNTVEVLSNSKMHQLKKKYTFQADPFIIEKDNKLYVFYEAFDFSNFRGGMLRCRILNNDLEEVDDISLEGFDELNCHLSFPFLFHLDGELFMIPESSERKEVILFQSVDFPVSWKKIKILVSDIALTDNTLLSLNNSLYLFSTTMTNEMVIHMADQIEGEWKRITPSLNVCNDHHRGAGKPYVVDDKIYILTQEYEPGNYGKSVYIKELLILDSQHFEERFIAKIDAEINHSDGVHTLNFTDNYIVYDTKIRKFSLVSLLKKILYKFFVKYRKYSPTLQHE